MMAGSSVGKALASTAPVVGAIEGGNKGNFVYFGGVSAGGYIKFNHYRC
jgi:hypothetical protein